MHRRSCSYRGDDTGRHHHVDASPDQQPMLTEAARELRFEDDARLRDDLAALDGELEHRT